MIEPTVGRVVWFYKYVPGQGHKGPMAAIVANVVSAAHLNLMVIDDTGIPAPWTTVTLIQDDDVEHAVPERDYCTWMPFQKGQAKKYETDIFDAPVTK